MIQRFSTPVSLQYPIYSHSSSNLPRNGLSCLTVSGESDRSLCMFSSIPLNLWSKVSRGSDEGRSMSSSRSPITWTRKSGGRCEQCCWYSPGAINDDITRDLFAVGELYTIRAEAFDQNSPVPINLVITTAVIPCLHILVDVISYVTGVGSVHSPTVQARSSQHIPLFGCPYNGAVTLHCLRLKIWSTYQ